MQGTGLPLLAGWQNFYMVLGTAAATLTGLMFGQTLIVTAGCGRVQFWGGPVEEIRPGDGITIPPGEKHWHGAAPTTAMTHIAVQEYLDGKAADWMEKVSDTQYQAG